MAVLRHPIIMPDMRRGARVNWPGAHAYARSVARTELRRIQDSGQFPTDPDEFVTRVIGRGVSVGPRAIEKFRMGKKIIFSRGVAGAFRKESIKFLKLIMRKVPRGQKSKYDRNSREHFRRAHVVDQFILLHNDRTVVRIGKGFLGRAIAWLEKNADAVQAAGDTLTVMHLAPYSLRLENGWSMQTPNGILRRAWKTARKGVGYRSLIFNPTLESWPMPSDSGAKKRKVSYLDNRKLVTKTAVYPSLTFGPAL